MLLPCGRFKDRPCRALFFLYLGYPGFGRPFRATHPGLWKDRPYRGSTLQAATLGIPLEAHTIAPWEKLRYLGERAPTYPWVPRSQHLWREYHYPVRGTAVPWGHIPRTLRCAYCCALGGNTAVLVSRTAVPWEHRLQHLEWKYRSTREQNCGALGAHTAVP